MVAITQKLISGYPSVVHAENKNTQVRIIVEFYLPHRYLVTTLDIRLLDTVSNSVKHKEAEWETCWSMC